VLIVDADSGVLTEPPDFLARGFVHDERTFQQVVPLIDTALAKAAAEGIGESHQLEQIVGRTIARWVNDTYRRNPIVLPIIIDA
jgi:ribonuclease J